MLDHRTFQIVLVSAAHPSAFTPTPTAAKSAHYTGAEIRLNLR
jgi:hypothetical protein